MNNDSQAVAELQAVSDVNKPHTVLHYLYVPNRNASKVIARKLERSGYLTESRLGADATNWLVLARHTAVPTEEVMAALRESMENLVADFDGEYDGWEAEVPLR